MQSLQCGLDCFTSFLCDLNSYKQRSNDTTTLLGTQLKVFCVGKQLHPSVTFMSSQSLLGTTNGCTHIRQCTKHSLLRWEECTVLSCCIPLKYHLLHLMHLHACVSIICRQNTVNERRSTNSRADSTKSWYFSTGKRGSARSLKYCFKTLAMAAISVFFLVR